MANYLADKSYLAVKPQSTPTGVVIPTNFLAMVSESIRVNPNFTADRRIKGLSWESDELLKGPRMIEGDITILCNPDELGHILNMTYLKGSTTGDATNGYTHPFTVGDGDSYTLEISRGAAAQRIWGARAESLKISFADNKMQAVVSIKALGQFYTASLGVALTGAGMTSAVLSTDSDLRPADGLVIGDTISINGTQVVLTSVNADGKTVGFSSTSITASVGASVYLVAQTVSLPTYHEPFYYGNTLVGLGVDTTAADTAAASRSTATPCYNLSMMFNNNLLDAPASGYTGPAVLLNQVRSADLELETLFTDPASYMKWLELTKRAATIITTGRFIKTDQTTSELLTVKFHKLKAMENEEPLDVGQYIFDKQKLKALYDNSDAAAVEITLVNRTAGTSY